MGPRPPDRQTLSAAEAAARLGVRRTTLYTYVSRGWLRSLPGENRRQRRYLQSEVEALRARSEAGRGHRAVATGAIGWGHPVIDTAVGAITPEGPAYRGLPAAHWVERGFDATCAALWSVPRLPQVELPEPLPLDPLPAAAPSPIAQLLATTATLGLRWDATLPPPVQATLLVRASALALVPPRRRAAAAARTSLAGVVAVAVGCPDQVAPIDAALVWCADHGLNASTFAARVAASTGAPLPAVVCAGLAALSGPRHGTASVAVHAFLDGVSAECTDGWGPALATREVVARLQAEGRTPPSLGHPLYPRGDPRAADLLARARQLDPSPFVARVVATLAEQGSPPPDLDFGLVALTRALELPRVAPQVLFAIGRMAGWLAHAEEERARGAVIRPRSRYVAAGHR